MGHTLEKYKGCDIIDLNPGACLWSQKLHDFLQPRTHVLLESTPSMWSDYQRPLLDKPGSTYKLFQGDIRLKLTCDALFEAGIIPPPEDIDPADPNPQKPNNTLLVTGSLMWDPPAKGLTFDSLGKQLLYHFTENARYNFRYHKYGPVRSLLWMLEEDFKSAIPRSHYMFSKYTVSMNYLAKNVQVVTPGHAAKASGHSTIGRLPQYEMQSVIRAMQRGKENGMEPPSARRENIHDFADDIARRNIEQGKAADARLTEEEMNQFLEQQTRAGKSTEGIDWEAHIQNVRERMAMEKDPFPYKTIKKKGEVYTAEGKRVARNTALQKSNLKKRGIAEKLADQLEAIYDRECEILTMQDGPEKEAALADLEAMEEAVEEAMKGGEYKPYDPESIVTERISLKSPVPRLEWDHRPYEPLVMHESEVWPRRRVCLIDSEPYPMPSGESANEWEWVVDFVSALYQSPNASVKRALVSLQSGASTLVDEVPSLRDPKKGGRLNLDRLRVNMLTREMLAELCRAYQNWPFKNKLASHPKYFQSMYAGRSGADKRGGGGAHGGGLGKGA
ncbi:hypothetical protein BU23DRAFT_556839 [Bimuria novae-zelandiae CBS 107.79]|uniref:Mitochondrial transcription factor 1 n=1 Tax=Bimuria novae-zelandiae CBS 107.79 TaxID=1447943 RepID=A0A6A5V0G7_9PLEO|nr:hypothetical protein BU23DRAFT_556839 [Bimuria novae-zelandiae CBS 107.79]